MIGKSGKLGIALRVEEVAEATVASAAGAKAREGAVGAGLGARAGT